MTDQTASVAVLESEIASMKGDISHIRSLLDNFSRTFTDLAAMEQRSISQRESIDRAFSEIAQLKSKLDAVEKAHDEKMDALRTKLEKQKDRMNLWIYGACGGAIVISAVWAVLGFVVRFTGG